MAKVISLTTYKEAIDWHHRVVEKLSPGKYTVQETIEDFRAFEQQPLVIEPENAEPQVKN